MFATNFVGGYTVGFIRGWKMTLVVTAALPLLATGGAFMMWALSNMSTAEVKLYSGAGSVAEEALDSIRTVVAFGSEEKTIERFRLPLHECRKQSWKGAVRGTMGTMFLSYALGFWYGGKLIVADREAGCSGNGCFDGGNALTVFFAVGQAGVPLGTMMKASVAIASLNELIHRPSAVDPFADTGELVDSVAGDIEFIDVAFTYPTREKPVFKKLNLKIPAGKTVALVGSSGGKDGLIQSYRVWEIYGGAIA
eukprot:GHVO01040996.1.p1 GENE.GHVO01040996.1~~GHVO01040996.1.p1  ORF type:complete len:252 (-),score=37.71 GHVO01040996.1:90-845(-)